MPRRFQGSSRHDAPDLYGAIYASESAVSAAAEQLSPFRGWVFHARMLERDGLPLAVARYRLVEGSVLDLDDPRVLVRERLRPSALATGRRDATQAIARALHERHPRAMGLRWWSMIEGSWINVTLFDHRARPHLRAEAPRVLEPDGAVVRAARAALGIG